MLQNIKKKRPITERIIIVGPNHFSSNQKSITYSDSSWHLSNGNLSPDQQFSGILSSYYQKNNSVIKNDHAIYNLLPDIKNNWPNALITPILIGQKYDSNQLKTLVTLIENNCQSNCLVVASVDFSHYLPASLANIHDQKSIRALTNLDLKEIESIEVDSPQSLYLAVSLAKSQGAKFNLFSNTNSGYLAQDADIETTTHVFAYYHKSIFPYFKNNTITFTYLPFTISNIQNQNTIGERFFYGVDDFKVANRLNYINQTLPADFIVSGYINHKKLVVNYLPININGQQVSFDRGGSKSTRVKELFDSIQIPRSNKDYLWSTITYELE